MKKTWGALFLVLVILVGCGKEDETAQDYEPFLPEEFVQRFLNGEYDRVYEQTSNDFQRIATYEQFEELGRDFNQGVNTYEMHRQLPELGQYEWISNEGNKGIRASFSNDYTITGIQLVPLQSNPEQDETFTENEYRMPINEEWFVYWGGINVLDNYHYAVLEQRYAYDLLIMENGASYEGDPSKNESYFAFGKDVVAPREGKVVSIESGMEDNKPGIETDALHPLGNYVIIEHEHNEFSIIAHLKKDSVIVNEGDQVEAGVLLGQVGNSGNTSEPHIHFQVSDGEDFNTSKSIRIKFEDNKSPVRGDIVNGF